MAPRWLYPCRVTGHPKDSGWRRPGDSAPGGGSGGGEAERSARLVSPDDDLPSSTYGGDYETTAIPSYTTVPPRRGTDPSSGSMGGGGGDTDDALPYVQPGPPTIHHPHSIPGSVPGEGESDPLAEPADRRGTQDLGLLLLRAALGSVLIGHGLQKLFGWWGGEGLSGFKNTLTDVGYQHADILTYVGVGGQIAAGVLLVLGLFTPLAAAGALAYLLNSVLAGVSTHGAGRLSMFLPGGDEYQIMLIVVSTAVVLIGPGRYGLDGDRGWARRPFIGSLVALLLGVGGGIAMWVLLNGANPLG